jgi:endonuclease/exonuclease/phosphatase family metal-dependent hydrolase
MPVLRTLRLRRPPLPDSVLERWGRNVGAPIAADFADEAVSAAAAPERLVVLSWNVWIGRGRLRRVIGDLRAGAYEDLGATPDAPLVALVQEAFRSDESVPVVSNGWAPRDRPRDFRPEEDIVEVARDLGLNLRYVPSMRNAAHRSDRGNAILSTLPLADVSSVELPFVVQRRVVLGASIELGPSSATTALRVYSAHLDPWGPPGRDWLGWAGRAIQAAHFLEQLETEAPSRTTIVGADLNTSRGTREAAYRLLVSHGFTSGVPHRVPAWRHTYHMVPRLSIDYLLFREPGELVSRATVHRLSEHPRDAGPFVFGSDHHPLLAVVELDLATAPAS